MAKVLLLQIGNDHIKIVLGVGLTHFDRTVNMGFELFKAFLFLYNKCSVSTEKIHYKQGLHGSCRVYNMKTVCKQFDIIGGIGDNEYGIICRHEGFEIKRIHLMHLQPLIRDMIFSNKVIEQYGIDTLLFEIDIDLGCMLYDIKCCVRKYHITTVGTVEEDHRYNMVVLSSRLHILILRRCHNIDRTGMKKVQALGKCADELQRKAVLFQPSHLIGIEKRCIPHPLVCCDLQRFLRTALTPTKPQITKSSIKNLYNHTPFQK